MKHQERDHFYFEAKAQDYKARSVFKLKEINERFSLIHRGDKVLDLGAAPGSWSQYVSECLGSSGLVVGVDSQKIDLRLPNVRFLQRDLLSWDPATDQVSLPFDVVLSDLAPKTTGIRLIDQTRSLELCQIALQIADQVLGPSGNFVCKLFNGESLQELQNALKKRFTKAVAFKPQSSLKKSHEIFLIGLGRKKSDAREGLHSVPTLH